MSLLNIYFRLNINKIVILFVLILALLLNTVVLAAEKVTFVVNSQGSDISANCSVVIATADYQYLAIFKGSPAGIEGILEPGDYIAVVKLNQQSTLPVLPVQVEFTVDEGRECLVETELKGMGDPMEMASQMMKIDEFIFRVEGMPANVTIMPGENDMSDMDMDMDDMETENIMNDEIDLENNDMHDLPSESEFGMKFKVNSELVVTVRRGNVRVIVNEQDYMLKRILNDRGYTFAGFDNVTGEMGCLVKQGESKIFVNFTPSVY